MEMTTLPRLEIEPLNFHFHNIQMVVLSPDPPCPTLHMPHMTNGGLYNGICLCLSSDLLGVTHPLVYA